MSRTCTFSRRIRLGPGDIEGDRLDVEDIRSFLGEYEDYDPRVVEVTFEVTEPVRDHS